MGATKTFTQEEIAAWGEALDEGLSYKHVGEVFGVHQETVSKYHPGRGWTRQQMGAHSQFVQRFERLVG